jgi:hypothetical protein
MKIVDVSTESGDWHAVYVDGVLSHQGHSIRPDYLVQSMGAEYESIEADDNYAEAFGFDKDLAVTMKMVNKEMPLPEWYADEDHP